MWPRAVELMLGLWVLLSPFVFLREPGPPLVLGNAVICGTLICTCSLLSFWKKARRAYLGNIAVALWLAGFGYVAGGFPSAPVYQNALITGLVLLLFAIIPSEANDPPRSWRDHYEKRALTSRQ